MNRQDQEGTQGEPKTKGPDAEIFALIERKGLQKTLWKKVGVAFKNRDGSLNLLLDCYPRDPTTGIQLRWKESDDVGSGREQRDHSHLGLTARVRPTARRRLRGRRPLSQSVWADRIDVHGSIGNGEGSTN